MSDDKHSNSAGENGESAVTIRESDKADLLLYQERRTQYYLHLLNMWGLSVFEVEKALMALSAGAIALLIALTIAKPTIFILALYSLSLLGFLVCLLATFYVLRKHEPIALEAINSFHDESESSESSVYIGLKAKIALGQSLALWSFVVSVAIASVLAISLRFASIDIKFVEEEGKFSNVEAGKRQRDSEENFARKTAGSPRAISESKSNGSSETNEGVEANSIKIDSTCSSEPASTQKAEGVVVMPSNKKYLPSVVKECK